MAMSAQDEFDAMMRDKSRQTGHPSDSPLNRSDKGFSDNDSSDDNRADSPAFKPMTDSRDVIPKRRRYGKTGAGGVIADAQQYEKELHAARFQGNDTAAMQQQRMDQIIANQPYVLPGSGARDSRLTGNNEDDLEDQDDDFMAQWRQKRKNELQSRLVPVDGRGFVEAKEGSGSDTVVVVYIYDDQSDVSQLFESYIETIAGKYTYTRFIKLRYQDAGIETANVPAIWAYRSNKMFAVLEPIQDDIPAGMKVNAQTLEVLFQRNKIL